MDVRTQFQDTDRILRFIYDGTATATGGEFFKAMVRATANAMSVRWAFISEFAGSRARVRTLSFWDGDDFSENFEYDLDGTVCEGVLRGEIGYYPEKVARRFPREKALRELGVESYLATPMTTQAGDVLGHLAVFDQKPMRFMQRELEVFKIFGARAAAELERYHVQTALQRSEARIASILDSALDAIIAVDCEHRIRIFNKAAERIFRCAAAWAVGQPLDRLLTRGFRKLVRCCIDQNGGEIQQTWLPDGILALRANGEEFPVEATLSPVNCNGEQLITLILRDVNEREQAKKQIRKLQSENRILKEEVTRARGFSQIVGDSPAMHAVFNQIEVVAATDATVLLVGETGTGKELIARAVHERSQRKDHLLVCVNCAALPAELVESELFGHEKGAFTGATALRKGRFELADGGTIFLDEVGELTLQAQAKLLRALQQQSFERVGGTRTLNVNVRVIAATNRDLCAMVAEGGFRRDLYYRLNVFPIHVPSLRDRRADIALLAEYFLEQMSRKLGKFLRSIDKDSLERLLGYSWPGNVRELQNVVERAAILAAGPIVRINDTVFSQPPEIVASTPPGNSLDEVQRAHILEILEQCAWRIEGSRGAALSLGLKPSTLRYRMQKLGIQKTVQGSPG